MSSRTPWIRTGVATGVAAILLSSIGTTPATSAPSDELIWEEGQVSSVADGDTLVARLDSGPGYLGTKRVRTIGVQAPEVAHSGTAAECGAAQATQHLRAQLPVGARVQTRSVDVRSKDDYSGGRIVRSLYARDHEDNWYDTSRQPVSDGWLMWFPLSSTSSNKPEWAHNLEYRVLADDAAAERRGLWAANLCGSAPYAKADLRVWAQYWGTEEVYVENRSGFAVDLSGWTVRDSAISGYRVLPRGTVVPAGSVRRVFRGDMNLNNLPTDNAAFQGDAVYLMDNAGKYETGNLRAWFPYPCNPDDCTDPLQGKLAVDVVQSQDPAQTKPSAPGSVTAVASSDGTGKATVTWAEPVNLGGPSVTYTLTTTAVDGGTRPAPVVGIGALSQTVSGLTLGHAYTFSVTAHNGAGASGATGQTPAVAPTGLPSAPPVPTVAPQGTSAVVSWLNPAGVAGEPSVRYAVSATPAPASGASAQACTTTDGATSCLLNGLVEGVSYSAAVTATLGSQVLTSAAASFLVPVAPVDPVDPGPTGEPGTPSVVRALPGDGRAVISWTAPDMAASGPIQRYDVAVKRAAGGSTAGTCSTDGTTSCVVDGLGNQTAYVATVTASIEALTGAPSDPSGSATPFAHVTKTTGGPTGAPPSAEIWVGGEIVKVTNRSDQDVHLGGYGLWDRYSANEASSGFARYLFPAEQVLGGRGSLLLHFGSAPRTKPSAPTGSAWLWTGQDTYINADDFVELANLNRAQVDCAVSGAGTCRGSRPTSVASSPVGLTAKSSSRSVSVSWGAPISRGGTAITSYTATAFNAPVGGSPIARCSTSGAARSCSFPATIGRTYYVEVTASNAQGTSGPSWRVRAVPRTIPGVPGSPRVTAQGSGVRVQWSAAAPNGAAVSSYRASAYTAATGGTPASTCVASGGALECVLTGLDLGRKYFIDVTATNRAGTGAASSPRAATSALGATSALSTYSKKRVTVRWDAPARGFAPVTGYTARVYTKAKGGSYLGKCSASAGAASCRTGKLKTKSKYYIELTTYLATGSYRTTPRILTGPPKKAGKPTVTRAASSARRVAVAWRAPSFTGYTYLKTYKARLYSKSKGGKSKATCYANAGTTTCTTKKLKKGTYYAAAQVKNSKGWSKWSKRVKVYVR